MKKDFHISQAHKHIGLDGNLPFWISMIKESQKVLKQNTDKTILDFGCADGKFLQLFNLMDNLKSGLGIDLNNQLIKNAISKNKNSNIEYKTSKNTTLTKYNNHFDAVYSQEVIYTIQDLEQHSNNIFESLKDGGFYFATIGSHIQNPLWSKRREMIRDEESYYAYDYSLEEIAKIFYSAGFEVGIKRLPVEYFLVYHPTSTKEFSNSLVDLVNTTYENKMLFSFWKPFSKTI